MKDLPFFPPSLPSLRAAALEVAILAGHLLLYPSGLMAERPMGDLPATPPPPSPEPRGGRPATRAPRPRPDRDNGETAPRKSALGTADTGAAGRTGSGRTGSGQTRAGQAPTGATPEKEAAPPPAPVTALPAGAVPPHPPVVLLHGFVDNRSVFVLLRRSLARHGWRHLECLNYSPLTCDIRAAAELLGRHIEEICARTGRGEVDVVGHSLGGLIARYYIQRLGGDRRIRTLVTLGTPHSGTAVAPLASAHPIVRQMRPGSPVIEELRAPAPGCRTRFVSFWGDHDQLMVPVETARLEHPDLITENVQVRGVGHLALPVHPAVVAGIRQALEAPGSATGTPGAISVA
ncbi:esterase/lipase family protein [Streptomyces sp. NPDC057638]|uniref:esterase/lipase family protein n=1 Tax=Streptomyces sp. NPDC057638 TaxID=3346190 RepID=UPI0036755C1C